MRGSRSSSSAGADAPSGDRVESGDRKVGGSGGDAGVSVVSGDWGVRGRGRGGGGMSQRLPRSVGLVAKIIINRFVCSSGVMRIYLRAALHIGMLVPYRTLAK